MAKQKHQPKGPPQPIPSRKVANQVSSSTSSNAASSVASTAPVSVDLKTKLEQAEARILKLQNELDKQIQSAQARISELETELADCHRPESLQRDITQLEARKSRLGTDVKAAEAQLSEREKEWERLEQRRMAVFAKESEVSRRENEVERREAAQDSRHGEQEARHLQLEDREKRISEQEESLQIRTQQMDELSAQLEIEKSNQEQRALRLNRELEVLRTERKAFDSERTNDKTRLYTWEGELRSLELQLKDRELNAEAGFVAQQRASISALEAEASALHEHLAETRRQIAERRREAEGQLTRELEQRRREGEAAARELIEVGQRAVESERQELMTAKAALEKQRGELLLQQRQLKVDREIFEEDVEEDDLRAKRVAAAKVEHLTAELAASNERLHAARQDRDEVIRKLEAWEDADRRFGHKSPEQVLKELRKLQEDYTHLEAQLAQRMSQADSVRLAELEQLAIKWDTERADLRRSWAETKGHLESNRAAVTELEGLRKHREALEASNKLLQSAVDDLQVKVRDLTTKADGLPVFPTCQEMDANEELMEEPRDFSTVGNDPTNPHRKPDFDDLQKFIGWTQEKMADGSLETGKLYYSLRDLRLFLGGLAMSHLHALQGISGTGKTSLPAAFAKAIGAGLCIIPVQAGWRDRHDLLGHYNAFERRFHETRFLQALYEASMPRWQKQPYFVVLDEFNLSRPEQYFADFISIFEQPEGERKIELLSQAMEPSPKLLEEGRFLPLPKNVWFLGTANHDETTLEIADKTYDRSHVMELPRRREEFSVPIKATEQEPLLLRQLEAAFQKASRDHAKEADKALAWLESSLREPLFENFRIGWGNRLERQAKAFVPVVKAAGGTVGEAVDHLLASRLLRRIKDRHDVRSSTYEKLRKVLEDSWTKLSNDKSMPERSLELIQHEINRLSFDRIDEEVQ